MSYAWAVNWTESPAVAVTGFGVTIIRFAGPGTTFTMAMSVIAPFLAVTVPEPGTVIAVSNPAESTKPTVVDQMKLTPAMALLRAS